MSLPATDGLFSASEHLPNGATLIVPEVSWDDYERLLQALEERGHLRVSYDCGRLEIMSPSYRHDRRVRVFDRFVGEYARIRKIDVVMAGHTTWRRRSLSKGAEADCSYYVKNVKHVVGKDALDLEVDPPPDIAVEIDITNSSLRKLAIYAALGAPEIWRYDGQALRIYELRREKYVEIEESRFLPDLTSALLSEYLEMAKTEGETKALAKFGRLLSRKRKG